ncbi:MAG: aspartate dehydrogenase, partial [Jatrophihabitans sp.]
MTLRVGVLGCGAIGRVVATALAANEVSGAELSGVVTHSPVQGVAACSLSDLLRGSDLVVEAAGQKALRDHAHEVLAAGVDLLVLSVGALADPELAAALTTD